MRELVLGLIVGSRAEHGQIPAHVQNVIRSGIVLRLIMIRLANRQRGFPSHDGPHFSRIGRRATAGRSPNSSSPPVCSRSSSTCHVWTTEEGGAGFLRPGRFRKQFLPLLLGPLFRLPLIPEFLGGESPGGCAGGCDSAPTELQRCASRHTRSILRPHSYCHPVCSDGNTRARVTGAFRAVTTGSGQKSGLGNSGITRQRGWPDSTCCTAKILALATETRRPSRSSKRFISMIYQWSPACLHDPGEPSCPLLPPPSKNTSPTPFPSPAPWRRRGGSISSCWWASSSPWERPSLELQLPASGLRIFSSRRAR